MATFAITTPVNIDSLATKAGDDTYNINGGYLTVDQHSRYGTNQNTSATLGHLTLSATLGGTVEFNSTLVRLIPYDTGTGNVPALGQTISISGASGILLGVYSALNVAPTTAGSAMPASGYILIRQWNETSYTAGALTGIGANATAADGPGWLEIVGSDTRLMTCNRLGLFKVRGDWYDFQGTTTDGTRATTYQIPTNGASFYAPGVDVQRAPNTITGATWGGIGIATYTATAHNLTPGTKVTVEGASPSGYNVVEQTVLETTANTFTVAIDTPPGTWTSGGSAYAWDFYPNAGSTTALVANIATDEVRGKWCWISTAGLLRFGHDGTNSTGGFIPPSGRKIRIPNIFFMNATTAAPTVNTVPHATFLTRTEFATSGGGVIDIDKACLGWAFNCSQAFSLAFTNMFVFDAMVATEMASPIAWDNVGIGQSAALSNLALTASLNLAGGTMNRCVWTRAVASSSGNYAVSWADCNDFTITNERVHGLALSRGHASTGTGTYTRVTGTTWTDCLSGAGKMLFTTCSDLYDLRRTYYDHPSTHTFAVTGNAYMWELGSNCLDCTFENPNFGGLSLVQPFNGLMTITAAGCSRIKLRNCGTYDEPLDLGAPRVDNVSATRVTTTATVTSVGHGLSVNDTIYVVTSSVTAGIPVGAKTVLTVADADTFTFAATNSGASPVTLSYYPTKCANVVVLGAGAAANDVRVQRVYCPHTRTNLFTGDNSSKNLLFENLFSDFVNAFTTPLLNAKFRGTAGSPTLAAQTATYGTHFMGPIYSADVTTNLAAQAWARSSTTVTVTSNDHKLRTGLFISVTATDNSTGVPLGVKTITVVDANTFTFTGVNSGTTSGVLTYRTCIDRIVIMMNEPTAETTSVTQLSGSANFTSAGGLVVPQVGDYAEFTMDEYMLGCTGFPIIEPVMGGGTIANYRLEYQLDINDGNGFGSYHNLHYARTGGSGSNGATTFTVTDATGVEVDDYVFGTNIAGNAKVTNVNTGTNTITVDTANIGAVSGTIRFCHLRNDGPSLTDAGIKLKVKITNQIASTTAITSLSIYTDTDDASRDLLYSLDPATLELTGLKNPTEVRVFPAGSTTEIAGSGNESVTDGTFTATIDAATYPLLDISIICLGYQNTRLTDIAFTADGLSIPVQQIIDRQYLNP